MADNAALIINTEFANLWSEFQHLHISNMNKLEFWDNAFAQISDKDWIALSGESERMPKTIFEGPWWHSKYYENHADLRVTKQHRPIGRTEPENPYERELFYPSKGRFALESLPVSYWSKDYETSRIEATDDLKANDKLTLDMAINYTSTHYLFSLQKHIQGEAKYLDLTSNGSAFFRCVSRVFSSNESENLYTLMTSSEDSKLATEVYPVTHKLSEHSYQKGFNGILYHSVRGPVDYAPHKCLVLFDRKLVADHKCLLN